MTGKCVPQRYSRNWLGSCPESVYADLERKLSPRKKNLLCKIVSDFITRNSLTMSQPRGGVIPDLGAHTLRVARLTGLLFNRECYFTQNKSVGMPRPFPIANLRCPFFYPNFSRK
ncbi:hypothetical protein TNIN_358001 [Trichonephila inaurata madagascariensis]|uniref:Uncharacterized protein n=1 Tax=Trichonephila inaurata madagascariensis TaxID=2747483 RepID=A0A8X6MI69_9ARAC|nr:hypothetical protein TNIN_358001 [Trichonephila inaurata madagascariensis]